MHEFYDSEQNVCKFQKVFSWFHFANCVCTLWHYGLWSFKVGGTKLEWFLPKNQHTQRKLLNFEFWINGKLSKSAKIWFSKSIFYVKNYPNLSDYFFIEEYHFRSKFFYWHFLITSIFKSLYFHFWQLKTTLILKIQWFHLTTVDF